MKNEHLESFWGLLDTPSESTISRGKITSIKPLKVKLREIEYVGSEILVAQSLVAHEVKADVLLADSVLHTDKAHKDLIDATIRFKSRLKVGDLVLIVQASDKQTVTVIDKLVVV